MSTRKWVVWSLKRSDMRGLVVDEGTEKYAKGAAERRNAAARRQKLADSAFVAMPQGVTPGPGDLPPAHPSEEAPAGGPARGLGEIQDEAARVAAGSPAARIRYLVAEAYEAGQDETAKRYRQLLGRAYSHMLDGITPEQWQDIRYMEPELFERLRRAILGEPR